MIIILQIVINIFNRVFNRQKTEIVRKYMDFLGLPVEWYKKKLQNRNINLFT